MRNVDVEYIGGGTPAWRQANEPRPVPGKVPAPALPAGIKQDDDTARNHVTAAQIAGFPGVAIESRPCQVVEFVTASMLFCDNVLNVKRKQRLIGFVQSTILALTAGPSPNERSDRLFHTA